MNSENLINAIELHDLDLLVDVLANGAEVNTGLPDQPKSLPLHIAVEEVSDGGANEAVGLLLKYGALVDGHYFERSATPLLIAVMHKLQDTVLILLTAGADPNFISDEGYSPLGLAIEHGDLALIAMLLRFGATKSISKPLFPSGNTPLDVAAANINIPLMKLLLNAGAAPEALNAFYKTAIRYLPDRNLNPGNWDEATNLLKRE